MEYREFLLLKFIEKFVIFIARHDTARDKVIKINRM